MANLKMRIEAILPDEGLDFPTKRFEQYRANAMTVMGTKTGPEIKQRLSKFTQGWDTKVDFVARREVSREEIGVTVFPRGAGRNVWFYVSGGVSAHPIFPKNFSRLRFVTGYSPHTRPGGGFGGSGTYSGNIVSVPFVKRHPGIKAREFEKQVKDQYEPIFIQDMQAVAAKAYV